jgi:hypothetical protein
MQGKTLIPHWYGSWAEMVAFGRECVRNPNWGGVVPLTLVDAHEAIATYTEKGRTYWKEKPVSQLR